MSQDDCDHDAGYAGRRAAPTEATVRPEPPLARSARWITSIAVLVGLAAMLIGKLVASRLGTARSAVEVVTAVVIALAASTSIGYAFRRRSRR